MTLSEDARDELAAIAPAATHDRLAELSALFHAAGRVHLQGRGQVAVHLDLGSPAAARRGFSLLRSFEVEAEIRTYRQRAFERRTRYQLHVPGEARALQVLHEAGILDARLAPLERPPRRVVARACCRAAYLRGSLLGAGSLTGPPARHLEIRTTSLEGARFLARLAASVDAQLATAERGGHAVAYAKGSEAIASVLAAAGASDTVLGLEERAVIGATRAHANRQANADHANLVRAGRAAHAQLLAIRRLEQAGVLADLPRPLREAAALRTRHPSLTLRELGRRARPPLSKAALHRRLTRLVRLAQM
jgi:cell division protein WhiA